MLKTAPKSLPEKTPSSPLNLDVLANLFKYSEEPIACVNQAGFAESWTKAVSATLPLHGQIQQRNEIFHEFVRKLQTFQAEEAVYAHLLAETQVYGLLTYAGC